MSVLYEPMNNGICFLYGSRVVRWSPDEMVLLVNVSCSGGECSRLVVSAESWQSRLDTNYRATFAEKLGAKWLKIGMRAGNVIHGRRFTFISDTTAQHYVTFLPSASPRLHVIKIIISR